MSKSEYDANKGFTCAPGRKPKRIKKQSLKLVTVLKWSQVVILALVVFELIKWSVTNG